MDKVISDNLNLGTVSIGQDLEMYLELGITSKDRTVMIGKRLAWLRNNAHMTQRDVCDALKISPQTYSGYESGRHEPTAETLIRLSYLFNISMDVICCKQDFNDDANNDDANNDEEPSEVLGDSNIMEIRDTMDKFRAETEAKMQEMQKQIEQLNNK